MWRIRTTTLQWKQNNTFCVCVCVCVCVDCCATMTLFKIHVTCNNANYMYQFLTEIVFELICTLSRVTHKAALKQSNVRSLTDLFRIWFNKW